MIRLGVSGHRFLSEVDRLAAGIDAALRAIDAAYGSDWTLLSSLAEGADRLVVERVMRYQPASRLVVPLPLAVDEYLKDWGDPGSREAFLRWLGRAAEVIAPPPASTREEAYRAAGRYVVDHAHIMIALWDGQGAQGVGGTGEIVALARERGLPLAWVRCGNRRPGTEEATSLGAEQGQVVLERFQVSAA